MIKKVNVVAGTGRQRIMTNITGYMSTTIRYGFGLILCLLSCLATAGNLHACFSIVAGRSATEDGSVLLAHNEDNAPNDIAGMVKMERAPHKRGRWVLPGDGTEPGRRTASYSYLCMHMPYVEYSDNILNEHGVAVVSNRCLSREDRLDIVDGGIGGPILRHLVAQRASSAREGVKLVGALVQRYGYTASGRTMIICDPTEGWLVGLVKGKHWVAARVPDSEVAFVANTYTLHEVDLTDKKNFLGSADLVEYAVERGWYSAADGPFDFEKAYASPASRSHAHNLDRQWSAMNALVAERIPSTVTQKMPFSIKPGSPLSVRRLLSVLRNHYEGTALWQAGYNAGQTPHNLPYTICNHGTNYSSVYQLRSHMPVEIGAVWWCALWAPCSSPYIPFYSGMGGSSTNMGFRTNQEGKVIGFGPAYGQFYSLRNWVHEDYLNRSGALRKTWHRLEDAAFALQERIEAKAIEHWPLNETISREMLSLFSRGVLSRAMEQTESFIELRPDHSGTN